MSGVSHLGNQDTVAGLDAHWHALSILVEATRSDSEDLALVELLNASLGQEDAAGGLGLGLDPLDEHAVEERNEGPDRSDRSGLIGPNQHWLSSRDVIPRPVKDF